MAAVKEAFLRHDEDGYRERVRADDCLATLTVLLGTVDSLVARYEGHAARADHLPHRTATEAARIAAQFSRLQGRLLSGRAAQSPALQAAE